MANDMGIYIRIREGMMGVAFNGYQVEKNLKIHRVANVEEASGPRFILKLKGKLRVNINWTTGREQRDNQQKTT